MIDVQGKAVSAAQVIAAVKARQTGVRIQRQFHDAPIDVLRQMLRHEASVRHLEVAVDHVDENILLVIPARHEPTSVDVYAAMNVPTGI